MRAIRAVVFDMDGVLVDSEPHWQQYWQEEVFPAAEDGRPTLSDVTGRSFRESLRTIEDEYGLAGTYEEFEEATRSFAEEMYRNDVTVTEGMPELFEAIRASGLSLGIASSSLRPWIEHVVGESALGPVDALVSADDIDAPGKPEPHIYHHAAEELSVEPTACLVVEDSENGVEAASRADATVVRYCCDHAVSPAPRADTTAEEIDDLRSHISERYDGTLFQ